MERLMVPTGTAAQRPSQPVAGSLWYDEDDRIIFYDGEKWMPFSEDTAAVYQKIKEDSK